MARTEPRRRNEAPPLYFADADAVSHAEETWRFTSATDRIDFVDAPPYAGNGP